MAPTATFLLLQGLISYLHSRPILPPSILRRAHALLLTSNLWCRKNPSRRLLLLHLHPSSSIPLSTSLQLFSHLANPDPLAANYLLKSLVRHSGPAHALLFFAREAHPLNLRPSRCTLPLLVTAAKLRDSLTTGEILHSLAHKVGFMSTLTVSNAFVHMYCSCDALALARQLFDEMSVRDKVTYNSLLDGYVKAGDLDEAERLFKDMKQRGVVSWATVLNGFVRKKFVQERACVVC